MLADRSVLGVMELLWIMNCPGLVWDKSMTSFHVGLHPLAIDCQMPLQRTGLDCFSCSLSLLFSLHYAHATIQMAGKRKEKVKG